MGSFSAHAAVCPQEYNNSYSDLALKLLFVKEILYFAKYYVIHLPPSSDMLAQQTVFVALLLSLLIGLGETKLNVSNCSCGALSTFYTNYRFGCECFRKQPMTNESVFPASSLPVNLTSLFLGVRDEEWESFRKPSCQAGKTSYSYLSADTMRLWEGSSLQFISFSNFNFARDRAKRISPWLENVKNTLVEMEIVCGWLVTLTTGVFVGFPKLTKLTITGSYLQYIDPGAFSELNFGATSVLSTLDLSNNTMGRLDWALMHPFASSLQSLVLTNGALHTMQASLQPFPELRRVDLADNYILTVPETVVKTWPKYNNLAVNLNNNPLCSWDSLCRCCSLHPLFRFVNETNAWIFMQCGNEESQQILNKTSFSSVSATPLCTTKYATRITVGDFMEIGRMSQFDRCGEGDETNGDITLCIIPPSSGSALVLLGDTKIHFTIFALILILTKMLSD